MMGGSQGESAGMLGGAVAAPKSASLELAKNPSTSDGVIVSRVLAPADGWVVVRSATAPGAVLGKTWVPKGPSRDVVVKLTAADGADVRVALHVDQGTRRRFEFDPVRPESTLDKPVTVEGKPVEQRLALTAYGVEAVANSVLLLAEDQPATGGKLTVRYLLLPGPAWISVNRIEGGLPGKRIGLLSRPAGESQEISVPLENTNAGEVAVTVFADRGTPGVFDFSPSNPQGSADQPYKSAGVVVSKRITNRVSGYSSTRLPA